MLASFKAFCTKTFVDQVERTYATRHLQDGIDI
jgi:hypothetical protein